MPGDQILADRGFTLQDDFAAGSCSLLINPAFTKGKTQLFASEVEKSCKISSVRIHIERVIVFKNRYTVLLCLCDQLKTFLTKLLQLPFLIATK